MIFGSTRRSDPTRRSTPDRRSTATGSQTCRRSLCLRSALREGATRPISSGRIQFIQRSPMGKAGPASPSHPGIQGFTRVKFVNSGAKCQGQSDKKRGLAGSCETGPLAGSVGAWDGRTRTSTDEHGRNGEGACRFAKPSGLAADCGRQLGRFSDGPLGFEGPCSRRRRPDAFDPL